MKKIVITSMVIFALLTFANCEKENSEKFISKSIVCTGLDFDLTENPYPIEEHLSSLEDQDEAIFDEKLYRIAILAKELFKSTELNEYIIKNAISHENDCIDLRNFRQWPILKECSLSQPVIEEFSTLVENIDLSRISKKPCSSW